MEEEELTVQENEEENFAVVQKGPCRKEGQGQDCEVDAAGRGKVM